MSALFEKKVPGTCNFQLQLSQIKKISSKFCLNNTSAGNSGHLQKNLLVPAV